MRTLRTTATNEYSTAALYYLLAGSCIASHLFANKTIYMNKSRLCANYREWQLSLWGAIFLTFGVGYLVASHFSNLSPLMYLLIIVGAICHGYGMWKINKGTHRTN